MEEEKLEIQNSSNQSPNGSPSVPNPQIPQSPNDSPSVINQPMGKLRSTASIGKPIIQAETNRVSLAQEPVNQTNKLFTADELQVVWDKLIKDLHQRNRMSEYVILNRKFTLDGTTIHIEVNNEIQVDLLTISLRTEILNHLRKELHNSTIHLEVVVSKEEAKTMIYTQADKFKFMAEKNPALHELKNILGLDYDY